MFIWRALFFCFLLFTVSFFVQHTRHLVIDTNLRDISPHLDLDQDTQTALDNLATDISKRVVFMLSAKDPKAVKQATAALRKKLNARPELRVLATSTIKLPKLLESLTEHRFHLLNAQQKQQLIKPDSLAIAQQAQASLMRLTSTPIIPFEQDPLGWHSDYVISLLDSISKDVNVSTSLKSKNETGELVHHKLIQLAVDQSKLQFDQQVALMQRFYEISDELSEEYGVEVTRAGSFFFSVSEATKSKRDIGFISTVSMVGVFFILLFMFRSVWPILLPFLSIATGVAFAFAVSHSLFGKVHIITILFGASLIGIVIDYSIHYFFHHAEAHHDELEQADLAKRKTSDRKLHSALLLSLITSLLGYSALYFSDMSALKKVALFSCCGLVMAWLCVICLGHRASKNIVIYQGIVTKLLAIIKAPIRYLGLRYLWLVIVLACGFGAFAVTQLESGDDPRFFFNPEKELIKNETKIANTAASYEPGRFVIISADTQEKLYERSDAFFTKLENFEGLGKKDFMSITNWLPSPTQQQQNYQQQAALYADSGALSELQQLLGLEQSMVTSLQREYQQAADKSLSLEKLTQLLHNVMPPLWHQTKGKYNNFVLMARDIDLSLVNQLTEGLDNTLHFDMVKNAKEVLADQRISASQLLLVAYVFIAILLFVRYRQVAAIKTLLVPLCSTALLISVLYLVGNVVTLFHVMALFLVLGLGMDYSIFCYEMRDAKSTRQTTQHAILISSITSLISFGLLGLSSIPVAQSFGIVLFLGNIFNLIGALIYTEVLNQSMQQGGVTQ